MTLKNECCSVCGNKHKEIRLIEINVSKDTMTICNECVTDAFYIMNPNKEMVEPKTLEEENNVNNLLKIKDIKNHLDQYVIGQENAKKVLSTAIYSHNQRKNNPNLKKKSNILMIGPTGSGKTLLVETLSKKLEIPMVSVDATTLTESGYSGGDVENIIKSLVNKSKSLEEAEYGIVFIDEIDKIAKKEVASGKKDIGGEGVQQALLKMIEGAEIEVQEPNKMNSLTQNKVLFNTKNILFVVAGAFVGLNKKESIKTLSFNTIVTEDNKEDMSISLNEINTINDKLEKFGLIPEFIGRFPIKTELQKLEKEDLIKIITQAEGSIIQHYKELFLLENVKLTFMECAFEKIADFSIKNELGARGLQQIIEKILLDIYYNIEDFIDSEIIIGSKFVESLNKKDLIVNLLNKKVNLTE